MSTNRRSLLKSGLGLGAGAGLMGVMPGMGSLAAANAAGGRKALVCIFLHGGMDCHDTLIPVTPGAYGQYAAARQGLHELHERAGDDSRLRANLISVGDGGASSGFGMPRQLAPLAAMHRAGHLSVVANVGTLVERTNRAAILDKRARIPARLGSHNDQRSVWATGQLEGTSKGWGWGGEMVDAASEQDSALAAITFVNDASFAASRERVPYRLHQRRVDVPAGAFHGAYGHASRAVLQEHYRAGASRLNNLFATDYQNAQRRAFEASVQLSDLTKATTAGDSVVIEGNSLSEQLAMTAKIISLQGALGIDRQVFLVEHRGFDTHQDQVERLTELQTQLADAMAGFYQETVRLGIERDVLTFTASEFGRTLTPNANGTDHGWGGHQFVMGGDINGGVFHGEMPEIGLGHDLDWDRGRFIPTTSVDQYAGGIARWFGVPESSLPSVLPNHNKFGAALSL